MRTWIHRVAMALALCLAACGGSARSGDRGPSSNVASVGGAGGDSSISLGGQANGGAGAPGVGAAGSGGGPGSASGGDPNSASGGEPSGTGGESGSAGAGGQSTQCAGLDCLAGAHLVYQPTRSWHAPGGPLNVSTELSEADYTAMLGQPIAVTFSDDALSVHLQPTAGGATVVGARDPARTDRAWYALQLPIGGRFVVRLAEGQFVAEHTLYGSGVPIVSSTRGTLTDAP